MTLAPGDRVGAYRVCGTLGAGGMGAVYEVEGPDGVHHAMKAPLPDAAQPALTSKRFAREANAMQLLDHPCIVRAIDQLIDGGRLYLVLELVRGPSLGAEIARGALAPRRALAIAQQVLDGLEHAHGRGLVHRDLKPDNVVITDGDRVKLLDFGLVKLLDDAAAAIGGDVLTRTGITFGTPAYMAPEQALGRALDGRVDLYALGVILFEMLTGALPFSATEPRDLLRAHVSTPPPRLALCAPGLPVEVARVVETAMAKRPDDRYADAAAMRAAVTSAAASLT